MTGLRRCIWLVLAGFAMVALPALLADPSEPGGDPISAMDWIAGTWQGDVGGETFWTQYTSPQGGLILSVSKTLGADGRATLFEFERWMTVNGRTTMTPYPAGKQSVDFTLEGWDPKVRKATFVNPQHDFPQSLTYERVGEDSLVIVLKGVERGHAAELRFDLKRVK
jgi:hypothetical protein